jgi:hypothetical protein
VTIPPLQMSKSVATHVSHANRFSHFVDARTRDDTTEATDETNLCHQPRKRLTLPARLDTLGQAKGGAVPMFAIHRRTQVIGRATAAVLSAALITATYAAVIPAGPNYFETVPAGTSIDFGRANISRGFFGPGSDYFFGFIRLQGDPVDPRTLGTTDTIMQRLGDINISQNERPQEASLGLVRVSLVSVNPITVTYNLGQNPELWDARVSLNPNQQQTEGRMTIMQTSPEGGTYDSLLPGRLIITFIRRSDNLTRVLTFGIYFGSNDVPWSYNADRALVTDHHFCPSCVAGESRSSIFGGPQLDWKVRPARGL